MVLAMKVRLTERPRKALFSRARRRKISLSAEVRKAIDLYLDFPPAIVMESPAALANAAKAPLNRSMSIPDDEIAQGTRTIASIGS